MQLKLWTQWTGTVAFRGLCDVSSSLSLNPVAVREDYTPEHTHTLPTELQSDRPPLSLLSHTHTERKVEGGKYEGYRGKRGGCARWGARDGERR